MTADAVGGVWHYAVELASGLCRRGTSVALAVMGPPPSPAQRAAVEAIDGLVLYARPFRLEWMQDAEDDLDAAAAWLLALEAQFEPDVVHVNGYAHASIGWQAPVVVVCHSCVQTWWQAVRGTVAPEAWNGYARRVSDGLRAADLVIAPSQAFLEAMQQAYGKPRQSMVIHNARSGPFRPHAVKEQMIIACGRAWDEAKGTDTLDSMAHRLPWPTYLAGDARSPDGTVSVKPEALHLLGRLEEEALADWLGRAAIFALPARYEPFGLSVLEAALSGCALVLGDIATLRELWDDAAVFADPRDPAMLAEATMRMVRDVELRQDMAQRALRRAQRYRPETMVAAYTRAYRGAAVARALSDAPVAGSARCVPETEQRL